MPKSNGICRVPIGERFFAWTKVNRHASPVRWFKTPCRAFRTSGFCQIFKVDDRDRHIEGAAPAQRTLPTPVSELDGGAEDEHVVVQRLEALYVKAVQNRRIKANVTADLRDHRTLP